MVLTGTDRRRGVRAVRPDVVAAAVRQAVAAGPARARADLVALVRIDLLAGLRPDGRGGRPRVVTGVGPVARRGQVVTRVGRVARRVRAARRGSRALEPGPVQRDGPAVRAPVGRDGPAVRGPVRRDGPAVRGPGASRPAAPALGRARGAVPGQVGLPLPRPARRDLLGERQALGARQARRGRIAGGRGAQARQGPRAGVVLGAVEPGRRVRGMDLAGTPSVREARGRASDVPALGLRLVVRIGTWAPAPEAPPVALAAPEAHRAACGRGQGRRRPARGGPRTVTGAAAEVPVIRRSRSRST